MPRVHEHLGIVLTGLGVSPGIVLGNAVCLGAREVPVERVRVPESLLDHEVSRLHEAVEQANRQIDEVAQGLEGGPGSRGEHQGLLDAYKLMLHDPLLVGDAECRIRDERINAEWALQVALKQLTERFKVMEDPFFRERGADIGHVGELLLRSLAGGRNQLPMADIPPGCILVAKSLSPADALALSRRQVGGFVLDTGTPTSHTAIIARSFGIPAVVGLDNAFDELGNGDRLIVDGSEGEIIVHPSQDEELLYDRRERRARVLQRALRQNRDEPAITLDGRELRLGGNLDLPEELDLLHEHGGEGIGLFRTEFIFMSRPHLPDEEEQTALYRSVLERVYPHAATIRTLDIGGDKLLPGHRPEGAFSTALRAVRYYLREPALFRTQLRALLRASPHGKLRILVPFVSSLHEVREITGMAAEVRRELEAEGQALAPEVPLGFMIEVPSAALIADRIARECDFLSVGTNDLIQYTLAISRDDRDLGYLYHPLHPAVIRLLGSVAGAARDAGIPAAVCGEMAGEPRYTLLLLAMGFGELSMNPRKIPLVKEILRQSRFEEAQALYERVRDADSIQEAEDVVDSHMVARYPDIVTPSIRGAPHHVR